MLGRKMAGRESWSFTVGETLFKTDPKLTPDGKTLYYLETPPTGRDARSDCYDTIPSRRRNQIAVVTRH